MMAGTAVVTTASFTRRVSPFEPGHLEMLAARDLGRDYSLVTGDLVGVDFPIMVDVQGGEESRGILLNFLEIQSAVMIPVGLAEPVGERVVVAPRWAERLAHRTNEHASMAGKGGGRSRRLNSEQEQRERQDRHERLKRACLLVRRE